jgi:hypothetical protein
MMSPASPLSFLVDARQLPKKGLSVVIEADAEQRARLADIHGVEAVEELRAQLTVRPWRAGGAEVNGRVGARIIQTCVVTLASLTSEIDAPVCALFVPEHSPLAKPACDREGELVLDPEGEDLPEVFAGGQIDIGALAEEFFGLAIDPYPKAPDAALSLPANEAEENESPFAFLRGLVNKSRA